MQLWVIKAPPDTSPWLCTRWDHWAVRPGQCGASPQKDHPSKASISSNIAWSNYQYLAFFRCTRIAITIGNQGFLFVSNNSLVRLSRYVNACPSGPCPTRLVQIYRATYCTVILRGSMPVLVQLNVEPRRMLHIDQSNPKIKLQK